MNSIYGVSLNGIHEKNKVHYGHLWGFACPEFLAHFSGKSITVFIWELPDHHSQKR